MTPAIIDKMIRFRIFFKNSAPMSKLSRCMIPLTKLLNIGSPEVRRTVNTPITGMAMINPTIREVNSFLDFDDRTDCLGWGFSGETNRIRPSNPEITYPTPATNGYCTTDQRERKKGWFHFMSTIPDERTKRLKSTMIACTNSCARMTIRNADTVKIPRSEIRKDGCTRLSGLSMKKYWRIVNAIRINPKPTDPTDLKKNKFRKRMKANRLKIFTWLDMRYKNYIKTRG